MRAIKLLFCHIPFAVMIAKSLVVCSPVTNSLNDNLRSYSVKEEDANSTNVRTLQKEDFGRYANFAPIRNPIRFKEIPDNALSGSSHSRGLLHHDHSGYGVHDYDDNPHHAYGYEYHIHDDHHDGYHLPDYPDHHHGGHHHVGYGHGHGHGHGHHHKHYNPALAAKAVLWPIAGIALLSAAAALVTNPVLLHLGVISGKRRRRDTEGSNYEDNFDVKSLKKWSKVDDEKDRINFDESNQKRDSFYRMLKTRMARRETQKVLSPRVHLTAQSSIETVTLEAPRHNNEDLNEKKFVPVPLVIKANRKGVKED